MGGKRSSLRWPVDMAHQGLRTMLVYPLESNGRSSLPTGQDLRNTGKTFRSFLNQSIEKGGGEEDGRDLLCLEQMVVIGNLQFAGRRDDDLFALQQWRPYLKCCSIKGVRRMKQHSFQIPLSPAMVKCQADNIAVCYSNTF